MDKNKKGLIKVYADEKCWHCGDHKGVAVSFLGGLPVICSCIAKQITIDGKQSLYDYIKENTKEEGEE